MHPYKNLAGNSGVMAYEIGKDSIRVKFVDGTTYLYTIQSAGKFNIEMMEKLALAGKGLSSFISTYVRNGYESKS